MKCLIIFIIMLLCISGCSNNNVVVNHTPYIDENSGVCIDDNNFNDPILKEYIKKYCDKDSNDYLSKEETDAVIEFPLSIKHTEYHGISSLDGLKFFSNLEVIDLDGMYFEGLLKLDLSNNRNLKELYLWDTNIKNLNIASNINLNLIILTDPLFNSVKLPNNSNKISISIHDVLSIESFNIDISDCIYFDDYYNVINDIDIENRSSNENGVIKVLKNSDLVKYSNGKPSNVHIDSNDDYSFSIRPTVFLKGQGLDTIYDDTRFIKYEDAIDYGLSGNVWFYIDSIIFKDSTNCMICGTPECQLLCESNGLSSVRVVDYSELMNP